MLSSIKIDLYTVKKINNNNDNNNLIIPAQGEFGKWHPGRGRENGKPFLYCEIYRTKDGNFYFFTSFFTNFFHFDHFLANFRENSRALLCIFFGVLECVGHSFANVAHLWFLRDVWIRTQSAAVASGRATNLATHLFTNLATHNL